MSFHVPSWNAFDVLDGFVAGTGPCGHPRQKVKDLGLPRPSTEDGSVFFCADPYCRAGVCQWPDVPDGKSRAGTLRVTIDSDKPIEIRRIFFESESTWKWRAS